MKMKLNLIFIVGTLLLLLPLVAGSHEEEELSCDDFSKEKLKDCEYILDGDLSKKEKEELLEILEDGSYSYENDWKLEEFELVDNSDIKTRELDYSRLILIWNLTIFVWVNYFAFSALTKSSFFTKWLNVVS